MPNSTTTDEYLDLVDDNDRVTGRMLRSEVYAQGLKNFRVVNAFIVNSEGKIWIPRRAANKRLFPLCLDMSMGGHVESGESYDYALQRETMEELNLDTRSVPLECLGYLSPQANGVSANMQVYRISLDTAPIYNPDDFVESFWLTPREIMDRLAGGDKSKGDLPKLLRHFYVHEI